MRPSTDPATGGENPREVAAVTEYPGRGSNSYDREGRGILSQPLGEQEAKPTHAVNPSLPSTDAAPVVRECPASSGPVATDFATAPAGAAEAPGSRAVAELLAYLADAVNADECAPAHWDTAVALAQAVGRLREENETLRETNERRGKFLSFVRDREAKAQVAREDAEREAAGLRADGERLDWLESEVAAIQPELAMGEPPEDAAWLVMPQDGDSGHGFTLRAAIDHARAAGGDAGAGVES